MGLDGDTSQPYARELAQRGYVVIVPDYWPMGHYRNKKYDPYQRGYASGAMKGVWNHMRTIDVLEALPEVDADRIGCIGRGLRLGRGAVGAREQTDGQHDYDDVDSRAHGSLSFFPERSFFNFGREEPDATPAFTAKSTDGELLHPARRAV